MVMIGLETEDDGFARDDSQISQRSGGRLSQHFRQNARQINTLGFVGHVVSVCGHRQ